MFSTPSLGRESGWLSAGDAVSLFPRAVALSPGTRGRVEKLFDMTLVEMRSLSLARARGVCSILLGQLAGSVG